MNERLKELYKEATGKDWAYDFDPQVAEKFAELLAKQCMHLCTLVENDEELSDYEGGFRDGAFLCRAEIAEYFGVKE